MTLRSIFFSSSGWRTSMSLNCGARSCVGWQMSNPAPPVACSLLICSSFCENGVELTLMPVSFSKSGITGSGNSSSQLMMLSSPEDESALETIAGEATAPSPSAADDFRNERRLTPANSRLWVDLYMYIALQTRLERRPRRRPTTLNAIEKSRPPTLSPRPTRQSWHRSELCTMTKERRQSRFLRRSVGVMLLGKNDNSHVISQERRATVGS